MARITCILDENVHRTMMFDLTLTKITAPGSVTMRSTPTAADPYASSLEITIAGVARTLPCPGITLLSKRNCEIATKKNGQFSMDFGEEYNYRVLLVGNELASNATLSLTIVNKKDITNGGHMSDFFVLSETGKPNVEMVAGDNLKIPPGVG